MSITTTLMAPGAWNLVLKEDTPSIIKDKLDWSVNASAGLGHIMIFDSRINAGSVGAATLIAGARYTGVLLNWDGEFQISGAGPGWWLGDSDDRGNIITTNITNSAASLNTWVTSLLPVALNAGTVTTPGGTLSATYYLISRRRALEAVCASFGVEYVVNPSLKLDVAISTTLFNGTPTAIVLRRNSGREPGLVKGLDSVTLDRKMDLREYITKAVLIGSTLVGTASVTSPYKDINGNTVVITEVVDGSTVPGGSETTAATQHLTPRSTTRRAVTLSSDAFDIPADVRPGDYLWVYDGDLGLFDNTNKVQYGGREYPAIKLRCLSMTWPVLEGYGVLFRDNTGAYTDLTDWIVPEVGTASIEIGATAQTLANPSGTVAQTTDTSEYKPPSFREAWTPTLRCDATTITVGNGVLACFYTVDGSWIDLEFVFTWGTTSSLNAGTGTFNFSTPANYPVQYQNSIGSNPFPTIGHVGMINSGVGRTNRLMCVDTDLGSDRIAFTDMAYGAGLVSHASPYAINATGNSFAGLARYRWR